MGIAVDSGNVPIVNKLHPQPAMDSMRKRMEFFFDKRIVVSPRDEMQITPNYTD